MVTGSQDRGRSGWPLRLACLLAIVLLAASVLRAPSASADGTVRDVRVEARGEVTRVVVDLSRRVAFQHLMLADPPRLAIDLPDVAWLVPESFGERQAGLVQGFRFGRFRPGVSRLVLDIAGPFEISNVFELPPDGPRGHRIVTELVALPEAAELGTAELVGNRVDGINGAAGGAAAPPDGDGSGGPLLTTIIPQEVAAPVPARRPPPLRPAPASQTRVIVIDPGHGGIDPGAIGSSGVYEKNVVLAMARELQRQLQAAGRYEVVLTRTDDVTVRLRDRLQIARERQGDLFLSLHADSLTKAPEVRGATVYTLSEEASSSEAALLASKENRADILAGVDLSEQEDIVTQILIDLAQRDANNKSIRFAETLVAELTAVTTMARRRRLQAGFVVLKSPDMPSVLIELGYLSNPVDEHQLMDQAHQATVAKGIVDAIRRYFSAEAS